MKIFLHTLVLALLCALPVFSQQTNQNNLPTATNNSQVSAINVGFNYIASEQATPGSPYTVGDIACLSGGHTVNCASGSANLNGIGLIVGTAPDGNALVADGGQAPANSSASFQASGGDFFCSDANNGGLSVDNGSTPCPANEKLIGYAVGDGSSTSSHQVDISIGDASTAGVTTVPPLNIAAGQISFITTALTGQSLFWTNGAQPAAGSPGIVGRSVSGASDTILCDSATAIRDRGATVTYTDSTANTTVAVTGPNPSSSGCGSNFFFGLKVTGTDVVVFTPSSGTIDGAASETFVPGQSTTISSPDNTNWISRGTTGTKFVCAPQTSTTDTLSDGVTTLQYFATTCKIPAGYMTANRMIYARWAFSFTSPGTAVNLTYSMAMCTVSGCGSGTVTTVYTSATNMGPTASLTSNGGGITFMIEATGAPGSSVNVFTTPIASTFWSTNTSTGYGNHTAQPVAIATNADEYITFAVTYASSTGGESTTAQQLVVTSENQ
jgi:hypothetical protein